jgi:hypothetical protein
VGVAAVAIPVLVIGGAYAWREHRNDRRVKDAAALQLAAADRARAEQIRLESAAQREMSNDARKARLDGRASRALVNLVSGHPSIQCDAALQLGRANVQDATPALLDLMASASSNAVRNCAASALVMLGERESTLRTFIAWSEGDDADLKRSALTGFGDIGPASAAVALPFFALALQSPFMDLRYVAVDSLAKLGPAAVPLLTQASQDADAHVRARAERAVRDLQNAR